MPDARLTLDGTTDPELVEYLDEALEMDLPVEFEYRPDGDLEGHQSFTGTCFVNRVARRAQVGYAGTFEAEIQTAYCVTRGVVPAA